MTRLTTAAGLTAAVVFLSSASPALAVQGQLPQPASAASRLLDVPFLPQTEDLCGGAAVAMVMRYWGQGQVYPEDFSALIDQSASGIRTDVLTADVSRRGWQAFPAQAGPADGGAWIRTHLDRGRPIIALIEVRPNRYHYVVVVARTTEQVIVHDPARAPFQLIAHAEFDRVWAAAGRWALLILPGETSPGRPSVTSSGSAMPAPPPATPVPTGAPVPSATPVAPAPPVRPTTPVASAAPVLSAPLVPSAPPAPSAGNPRDVGCGQFIDTQVALAKSGDLQQAERGLLTAVSLCPHDPAAWRELAGIRFLQSRWGDAADLAEHAAGLDPEDSDGWELLATSQFLNDQPDRALTSWNRLDRPLVDVLRVTGSARTRQPVIAALIGLPPRAVLTAARYGLAARRLDALPSAAATRLRFRPVAGGLAEIDAVVVERPVVPHGVVPVAALALRTAIHRELRLDVSAPTGSGELWTAAWRWWEARPRVAFAVAVPAVAGVPGVVTIEGLWERASYAAAVAGGAGRAIIQQERRRAGVRVADWATRALRWSAGLAMDRWDEDGHVSADAGLDLRAAGDRLAVGADVAAWVNTGAGSRFARTGLSLAARSTIEASRRSWSATAGLSHTTAAAPFDLWPGADTGQARVPLLRAHPLLDDGVVTGPAFGRQLAHASAEFQQPVFAGPLGVVRVAAFVDVARAWHRTGTASGAPWQADAGAGTRVALPGNAGALRVDVARGLRDGRTVLSAGWLPAWPGR